MFWTSNAAEYCLATPGATLTTTPLHRTSILNSIGSGIINASITSRPPADCVIAARLPPTSATPPFASTFDALRQIARHEGLPSLWRGLSPTLAMAVPGNVIYFAGYDALRASSLFGSLSPTVAPLAAGAVARVAAAAVVSPVEMFRTRLQAFRGNNGGDVGRSGTDARAKGGSVFRDTMGGMGELVRTNGLRSLWRGLTLTMWRDVPFSAIYWWGYEAVRDGLADVRGDGGSDRKSRSHATTFVDAFMAGASSGAVALGGDDAVRRGQDETAGGERRGRCWCEPWGGEDIAAGAAVDAAALVPHLPDGRVSRACSGGGRHGA